MTLQAVGSFLVIHTIGLKKTHFLIPFLLLGSALCSWIIPSFALISFSYVFLKAIDFSLFSISREMLYIPFGLDEKFRAKAIIDVFAYRSSKALVSLSIISLQAIAGIYLLEVASYVSVAIFIGWIFVVFFMLRHDAPVQGTVSKIDA
jgi:ATP/ADP translocase